jgi:hypothetical protein
MLKNLPRLRGSDSCCEHCYTIICLVVCMSIGFIIFAAGAGARNVAIASGVILVLGILSCIFAAFKPS